MTMTMCVLEEIILNLPPLRIPRLRHHRVTDWDPYFENADGQGINGSQNVALHLGATALLDCRVAMLSGKKVRYHLITYNVIFLINVISHLYPWHLQVSQLRNHVYSISLLLNIQKVLYNIKPSRWSTTSFYGFTGDVATTEHRLGVPPNSW